MPDPIVDPAVTPPVVPTADWFAGITDTELRGHVTTRGWEKLPVDKALNEALNAHRSATVKLGIPEDQIIRMPGAEDVAGRKALMQRLGAPADPKDYTFEEAVFKDNPDRTSAFAEAMRATAARLNMPASMAQEVAKDIVGLLSSSEAAAATTAAGALAAEKDKLSESWGTKAEANLFVAKQGAAAVGVAPEAVVALEKAIGYAAVMEMFRNIGARLGEDRYVAPGSQGGPAGPATREQAIARKAELFGDGTPGSGDQAWQKKYLAGDQDANRELQRILQQIG